MHHTTCDKLGRVVLPPVLRKAAGLDQEIVVAGVLNKIEIWSKTKYEKDLEIFLDGTDDNLAKMTEDAFALLDGNEEEEIPEYQEV